MRNYLPRKVKSATPRARIPRIMPDMGKARNAAIPYIRKNRTMHQPAIVAGVFI
jgi:hypothetical protein